MQNPSRYAYAITPKQIIFPSKLVLMNDVMKWDVINDNEVKKATRAKGQVIERKFHNFELSPTSRSKIIKKINWLFHCSKSRVVKSYSGKEIYNFKVNFITLTLPSKQIHPTSQIIKECFERFLNEMRTRCKMNNYVWRLEFQGNGNVHFHIVTDVYIDYFFVLKVWNRIINYLGYVDAYTNKMSKLKFHDYVSLFPKENFDVLNNRYIKGRANGWKSPNSVDCKNANNQHNIAMYIAKYFSKKKDNVSRCNELDNEENSFGLRLWFSSRSLSKMDTINQFTQAVEVNFELLLENAKDSLKVVHDYCTVIYFNFASLSNYCKSVLGSIFREYQRQQGYKSAG